MHIIGYWSHKDSLPLFEPGTFKSALANIRKPLSIVYNEQLNSLGLAFNGTVTSHRTADSLPLIGALPPLYPEWLGNRSFQETHNTRFAYVGGAMARGIASAEIVISLARAGMIGFFGAAGLPLPRLEKEIDTIKNALDPDGLSWGVNLIHAPSQPGIEEKTVELFLQKGVRRIEASAFMTNSPSIVRFALTGLKQDAEGSIIRKNHVFAKISRPEVARHFLEPAPDAIINDLLSQGLITTEEARLGRQIPVAGDITVESDSGGHTDSRPLGPLFSAIMALSHQINRQYKFAVPSRIGAAGGLGTPQAIAAAFAMGASYVCVGSVHQGCIESGAAPGVKKMLANAGLADIAMTACADMFEMGVKVQVLKRGTMMPQRGNLLYSLYSKYKSLDEIPASDKAQLEKDIFRTSIETIWNDTRSFFEKVEPAQVERAERDPKHKMALVFRWYIGKSSQWPIQGTEERKMDYQIWCGPAMGAFNDWVRGSFLEDVENRNIQQVALNLMEGAARLTRAQQLRTYGVPVPDELFHYQPVNLKISFTQSEVKI
jgi:trans-AT polyketide synthase/acyltransferase/oxidoreductase domain-containing protein